MKAEKKTSAKNIMTENNENLIKYTRYYHTHTLLLVHWN